MPLQWGNYTNVLGSLESLRAGYTNILGKHAKQLNFTFRFNRKINLTDKIYYRGAFEITRQIGVDVNCLAIAFMPCGHGNAWRSALWEDRVIYV